MMNHFFANLYYIHITAAAFLVCYLVSSIIFFITEEPFNIKYKNGFATIKLPCKQVKRKKCCLPSSSAKRQYPTYFPSKPTKNASFNKRQDMTVLAKSVIIISSLYFVASSLLFFLYYLTYALTHYLSQRGCRFLIVRYTKMEYKKIISI